MIPATLQAWSLEVLRDLLSKGYYETDRFDFKEMLPRDADGRLRLAKTSCAFANSQGGFLVYGVSADTTRPVDERLVGLERTVDFPVAFGPYPARCTPSVDWTFQNPPLPLPNGRCVQIVQVPFSGNGPHAVDDEPRRWHFTKRTPQGNEAMSMDEIRAGFLGYYEKRVKLRLLRAELEALRYTAGKMVVTGFGLDKEASIAILDLQRSRIDPLGHLHASCQESRSVGEAR